MSLMKHEVYNGKYYLVETNQSDLVVPIDVAGTVPTSLPSVKGGWLYRISAPSLMDSTDWGVAHSELDALESLLETYGSGTFARRYNKQEDWENEVEERIMKIKGEIARHGLTGD